jgi:hypothetical protein
MKREREDFKVNWDELQRPGFSPDFSEQPFERMDIAWKRSDWVARPRRMP